MVKSGKYIGQVFWASIYRYKWVSEEEGVASVNGGESGFWPQNKHKGIH